MPPKSRSIIKLGDSNLSLIPSLDNVLTEAMGVLSNEVTRLSLKSRAGKPLDSNENKIIQGHIKALLEINKDAREQIKKQNFDDMETAELVKNLLPLLKHEEVLKMFEEYVAQAGNTQGI